MTLGHNGAYFPSRVDNLIKFEFTEHEWRHVPETSFTPLNDQNTPLLHPEEYQYLYGDNYNYQPGGDGVGVGADYVGIDREGGVVVGADWEIEVGWAG